MEFNILTIFPNIFDSYLDETILARAQKTGFVKINIHSLRDWARDKHKTVDHRVFGGGPGMVMKIGPIYRALHDIKFQKTKNKKQINSNDQIPNSKIILLSAKGRKFDQKMAKEFSKLDQLVLICGRYEGVDERVAAHLIDKEVSIGNYVLSGGELPAMVITEAVSRLIPGVLGNKESLHDSGYPVYTRPEKFKNWKVPKVLLSGDHKKIKEWREKHTRR
ncbi:tRNA (guanosine(37)-N1)-methyltransferase TrmD [bacterium]|nr:tRNA (guanosine(37)-N1)-methyltransferase TrmD [bacterium]